MIEGTINKELFYVAFYGAHNSRHTSTYFLTQARAEQFADSQVKQGYTKVEVVKVTIPYKVRVKDE